MPFDAKLTGDAAALARANDAALRRLPATVEAFILVDLQRWAALFPPEQRYQRALLEHLSKTPLDTLLQLAGGIADGRPWPEGCPPPCERRGETP